MRIAAFIVLNLFQERVCLRSYRLQHRVKTLCSFQCKEPHREPIERKATRERYAPALFVFCLMLSLLA